ncbi:Rieske (2Fe-2S) protein [Cytophagaceae bacterium DM2B3-1]|uniref:Rieske (2Fe-2S) protein n=1 Tax=Xanthocytophaga flava TaxID=3048013 RepID=A0ABT7CIK8_9BACT|nr:Rieske (2Fe-2S) protein [Xanthocytophaga flavus]MDJ1493574.1 Rieske (2Fe-2S) protein [Xanthocytophaga flavus]
MKRSEFLKNLGLSSAALMSIYCLGGLTSCASESPQPNNNTGGNGGGGNTVAGFTGNAKTSAGKISFTLDLTTDNFKSLLTEGSYLYPNSGDVIVAKVKGGGFVALSKACTHQGTTVTYRLNQNDFYCDNHGSEFSTTGSVENGPATAGLTLYAASLDATTNILTVSA